MRSVVAWLRLGELSLSSRIVLVIIAGVAGWLAVCGLADDPKDGWLVGGPALFALGMLAWAAALLVIVVARALAPRLLARSGEHPHALTEWSAKSVALGALVLLACWVPALVALYPGSMNWDTYYQIYQCFPENHPIIDVSDPSRYLTAYFHDHHPVFDTWLYGAFGMLSQQLTGNWNAGLFALACLQEVGLAFGLSLMVSYLDRLGMRLGMRVASLAFCAVFPTIVLYNATVLKDMTFTVCFLPWFVCMAEVVRTRGEALGDRRLVVAFAALAVLLALTKKTGIYVVVPAMLVAWFVCRRHAAAFAVSAGLPVLVMYVIMPYVVFPLASVEPGGSQEVLGTLFQQTARYVKLHGDEIPADEREAIDGVLEYDKLAELYDPLLTDAVKYTFRHDSTPEQRSAYLRVWLREGMRDPGSYVEATFLTCAAYFSPRSAMNVVTTVSDVAHGGRGEVFHPGCFAVTSSVLGEAYYATAGLPVVGLLLKTCFWLWWVPALAVCLVVAGERRWLAVMAVPVLTMLTFVISPVLDVRYGIHVLYAAPLLIGIAACASARPPAASGSELGPAPDARDADGV